MVLKSKDFGISFLCSPGIKITGFDKGQKEEGKSKEVEGERDNHIQN